MSRSAHVQPLNHSYGRPPARVLDAIAAAGGVHHSAALAPPAAWTLGIASLLPTGGHALLVDVDGAPDWTRIGRAARRWRLPAVHIWETAHGYHLMAMTDRPAHEIAAVMAACGGDPRHVDALRVQGYAVLRIRPRWEGEREYIGTLPTRGDPPPSECAAADLPALYYAGERLGSVGAAMAKDKRGEYSRLLRWWLDQGYSLDSLIEGVGGVRRGDHVDYQRKTGRGGDMRIPARALDAIQAQARDIRLAVQEQGRRGARMRIPRLRLDSGKYEAWRLSGLGDHTLKQEMRTAYRDARIDAAPPSLRVAPVDRQGRPMLRIEGVGKGAVRSPGKTDWTGVLRERRDALTAAARTADRRARTARTAPARDAAVMRAGLLREEREAVRRDLRRWGR